MPNLERFLLTRLQKREEKREMDVIPRLAILANRIDGSENLENLSLTRGLGRTTCDATADWITSLVQLNRKQKDLVTKAINVLCREGYRTVDEVRHLRLNDVLSTRNIGKKRGEVIAKLFLLKD